MHGKAQKRSERETNPALLRQAVMRIVDRRIIGHGELDFPCIPSLCEAYVAKMTSLWADLARRLTHEEAAELRRHVELALTTGYDASPFARMVVTYAARPLPAGGVVYEIRLKEHTMAEHYASWTRTREPPLFGKWPDAKVLSIASALGEPGCVPVLDVGAGTGRNAISLARRGHPTDAIELVPEFAEQMRDAARLAAVELNVIEGDILTPDVTLARERYKLVVLSEVMTHFRDVSEIRMAFSKFADVVAPGGLVVFNAFLPVGGYNPDATVRQMSQTAWSCLFMRGELEFISKELPFDRISDECAHTLEKENLPPDAWPPTGWFESWSQGQNVFDLPAGRAPIELRWLVYRKR